MARLRLGAVKRESRVLGSAPQEGEHRVADQVIDRGEDRVAAVAVRGSRGEGDLEAKELELLRVLLQRMALEEGVDASRCESIHLAEGLP